MKVDLNRKFKDFKGGETENVVSDKVAEALYSAGISPEFAIKREDKFRAYKLCKSIMDLTISTCRKEVRANLFN